MPGPDEVRLVGLVDGVGCLYKTWDGLAHRDNLHSQHHLLQSQLIISLQLQLLISLNHNIQTSLQSSTNSIFLD